MTLLGSFLSNLGNAFASLAGFLNFLQEMALLLPLLLELVIPITLLLATIATFSAFSKTSEVIAMRASGMGTVQFIFPILAVASMIAFFNYGLQHYLYPYLQQKWGTAERFGENSLPPLWKLGKQQSLFYLGSRYSNGQTENIAMLQWKSFPHRLQSQLWAETGIRQATDWIFAEVTQYHFQENQLKIQQIPQIQSTIEELPSVSFQAPTVPHYQPVIALFREIHHLQQEGLEVTQHWIEFYQKLAYPFQLYVMVIIGNALSATHSRRGSAAEALAISCFLGIVFWILNQILLAVGSEGAVSPFLAAWGANLIFCGIAFALIHLNRT